jgi:hypothetical protein
MWSESTLVVLYLAFLKTYTNILSFVLPESFNHLPWPLSNRTLTTHKPIAWPGLPTIQIPTYVKPKQKPSTSGNHTHHHSNTTHQANPSSEEDAERARRAEIRKREAQEKEAEDARQREEERQRRRQTSGDGKPRWEDPYGIPPEPTPVRKEKPLVPVPWDF